MQAYGGDRLRIREDGAAIISCRVPKQNWQARIEKTLTTPEHPGTAIEWDGEQWEVVGFEVLPAGVRYTLQRWPADSATAIRVLDHYDAESEAERARQRELAFKREQGRKAATLLGIFTGHLPAIVQDHLGSEIGINPVRLTMISTVPPFVIFGALVLAMVGNMMRAAGAERGKLIAIPLTIVFIIAYGALDSLVRFFFAMTNGRPMGSVFGLIGYGIFYAFSKDRAKLVSPFAEAKGTSIRTTQLTAEDKLASDLTLIEPLFSLLDASDQRRVAEKYGINYRQTASLIAGIILVFSMLGFFTSIPSAMRLHLSGFVSILVAGWLGIEQAIRLARFKDGPAPSVLRFVVRPFVAKYLG